MKPTGPKIFLLLAFMLFAWHFSFATHNRAGEITYKKIGPLTYEVTLITYTDTRSVKADRASVDLFWGDGTKTTITRGVNDQITLPNFIWKNIYVARKTYAGPGEYIIYFEDPNRVADVLNMENSVGTPFYIESLLIIDPQAGFDQSPVLLNPPIDNACYNQVFTHNPNAYDPDGDSLVFKLIPPKQAKNTDVAGYRSPAITPPMPGQSFTLDMHTGQIVWTKPQKVGIYNVAILIEEYRNKKRIGYIIRDMQINVTDCQLNNPPVVHPPKDTCIEAGKNFNYVFPVYATDKDSGDSTAVIASGGPFLQKVSPAIMINNPTKGIGKDTVRALFEWKVDCAHIRRQPYLVVFKAIDIHHDSASDIKTMQIKVVGPAPKNLLANPAGNSVILTWEKPDCPNPVSYFIYRRADSTTWHHGYCETGVPGYVGYQLIDTVRDVNQLTYIDSNRGNNLSPGIRYCYVVTAVYLNQGQYEIVEGYASNEDCAQLKKDVPVLTHASVRVTSGTNGSIYVDWSKPVALALDTGQNPGPYMYKLYRSPGINTNTFTLLNSSTSNSFSGLNDTTFIDTMLNTAGMGYTYKVEFYNTSKLNGKWNLLGKTIPASSPYLEIGRAYKSLVLTWKLKTPWENSFYTIYRKNKITFKWDSIGTTAKQTFIDSGLENGIPYCYYIQSHGSYLAPGFVDPIINLSETMCASPRDTVKPCAPLMTGKGDCDSRSTQLNWSVTDSCTTKVTRYKIYYSTGNSYKFENIDSVLGIHSSGYTDMRQLLFHSMAGCYYVTAVDSYDNESLHSQYLCVDNCPRYELPNVITPNGDERNDVFTPMAGYRFIDGIDIKIYNRWGQEVFSSTNPDINWDGTDEKSHRPLNDGVYYYYCEVREIWLDGIHTRPLKGTVSVVRQK